MIEAAAPFASAVKINVAFFEAFGSAGWAALERTRADVPADVPCILDAKRGDIETSAERYAEAILGHLDADGVTVSPYLGEDAVEPFRNAATGDRLVYVLARTSNPSAGRFQSLVADGDPIHLHVARWVAERWTDGRVGLVVGATAPDELATIREAVPGPRSSSRRRRAGWRREPRRRSADGSWAPGLVNVSRGIALASSGADWREAAAAAASAHAGRLADAVLHSEASPVRAGKIGGS